MPSLEDWNYKTFEELMPCNEASQLFDKLILEEPLDPEIKGALLGHLDTCDACFAAFAEQLEIAIEAGKVLSEAAPTFVLPPQLQAEESTPPHTPILQQLKSFGSQSFYELFERGLELLAPNVGPIVALPIKLHWYLPLAGHASDAEPTHKAEERVVVPETETAEGLFYKIEAYVDSFYITVWSKRHDLAGRRVRVAYRAPGVTQDPLIKELILKLRGGNVSIQAELLDDRLPDISAEVQELFVTPPLLIAVSKDEVGEN